MPQQQKDQQKEQPKKQTGKKGMYVAPSPLNAVKLDLGLFMLVGLVLWIVLENITISETLKLAILGAWSLIMLLWVVLKTKAIIKKSAMQENHLVQNNSPDGAEGIETEHLPVEEHSNGSK